MCGQAACKPGSVPRLPARRRTGRWPSVWDDGYPPPQATYPRVECGAPWPSYLVLLRAGLAQPDRSPGPLVRSYRTVSPLPPAPPLRAGERRSVSVALSVGSPPLDMDPAPCRNGARTFLGATDGSHQRDATTRPPDCPRSVSAGLFDVREAPIERRVGKFIGAGVLPAGDVPDAHDIEPRQEPLQLRVQGLERGVLDAIAALELAHDELGIEAQLPARSRPVPGPPRRPRSRRGTRRRCWSRGRSGRPGRAVQRPRRRRPRRRRRPGRGCHARRRRRWRTSSRRRRSHARLRHGRLRHGERCGRRPHRR